MARNQKDFSFDASTLLKDAGAVTATAAAQVGGVDKILDVGAARLDARVIIDVSAIDITTGDEAYDIRVEGSNSPTFANTVKNLVVQKHGDSTVTLDTVDTVVGRYELCFTNEQNGVTYRYIRVKHVIAGTTPSINYTAELVQDA